MTTGRKLTIRQEIISLLEQAPMTARDISQAVSIMEKDVPHHLSSIEKTLRQQKKRLETAPHYCMDCGFEFTKRKSFKKPGKCPGCRDGRIASAVYRIVPGQHP
ncbi:MAG: ArsR family transcriptional regulator [Desulfobacterales bacterium]|nr:ArsR family transcriptional regulator [Desulfobacterales bacterium]